MSIDARPDRAHPQVMSSIHAPRDSAWNETVHVVSSRDHGAWLRWMTVFLRQSRGREAFIVRGTSGFSEGYRDLLAAGLLRRLHPRSHVVISDATIEPGSKSLARRLPPRLRSLPVRVSRGVVRFADGPNVTWCVLSTAEEESFPETWGLSAEARVTFTPFSHTVHDVGVLRGSVEEDFLFSGGNSLRDYDMLIEAAEGLPLDVRVATSWVPGREVGGMRFEATSHTDFMDLLRRSRAVVLPLEQAVRSTGQQTYLNAMALGKVVIVNDAPGVRDHIEDGVTGVVVQGVHEMRRALWDVVDPGRREFYASMGRAARSTVLRSYAPENYRERLLSVAVSS